MGVLIFATPAVFRAASGFQAPPLGRMPAAGRHSHEGGQSSGVRASGRDHISLAVPANAQHGAKYYLHVGHQAGGIVSLPKQVVELFRSGKPVRSALSTQVLEQKSAPVSGQRKVCIDPSAPHPAAWALRPKGK
eukprot:3419766-Pyramimonas_sp.AAC.1